MSAIADVLKTNTTLKKLDIGLKSNLKSKSSFDLRLRQQDWGYRCKGIGRCSESEHISNVPEND